MFESIPVPDPITLEVWDILDQAIVLERAITINAEDIPDETMTMLTLLPGVTVSEVSPGDYQITLPAGVEAKFVASDPAETDTWLYRFSSGQLLGHDSTATMMAPSVWPAEQIQWDATTPFEFALACH